MNQPMNQINFMPPGVLPKKPMMVNNINTGETLYIGNLEKTVNEEKLMNEFSSFGKILGCKVMRDTYTGYSRGFGFVTFELKENAEKAQKMLNYKLLNNQEMRINFKRDKNSFNQEANVFVKNLKAESSKDLEDLMKKYGNVLSCIIKKNYKGESLGFGYVQFEKVDEAIKAVEELNGKKCFGDVISLERFIPQKYKNSDKCTIYVRNFPNSWSEEQVKVFIKEKFLCYGMVSSNIMKKDKNGTTNFFGYLNFDNSENAAKAIKEMNSFKIEESLLTVENAMTKKERKAKFDQKANEISSNCSLFLKGINSDVTEEQVKTVFSKYGNIVSMSMKKALKMDNQGGFYQYCFINYSNNEEAKKGFFEGKKDEAVQTLFCDFNIKKKDFISFAQKKNIRQQYLRMKQRQFRFKKPMFGMQQQHNMQQNFHQMQMMQQMPQFPQNNYFNQGQMQQQNKNYQDQPLQNINQKMQELHIKEEYDLNWLINNKQTFEQFTDERKREILGENMFKEISTIEGIENDNISKVTGMLIDLEILTLEEILDLLQNKEDLMERVNEAIEIIKDDN